MICPNCKNESFGAKWCPECGLHLEIEDVANTGFNNIEKGDTQKLRPVSLTKEDTGNTVSEPYQKNTIQKKKLPRFSEGGYNYWLIAVGVAAVLVVMFVMFRFLGIIPTSQTPGPSVKSEEVVLEKENLDKILETGLEQLKLGNYDEAETVFKTVIAKDKYNPEADTLYQIVYNYNRAVKKLQSAKYEEARDFFNEIPLEYADFSIKTDVENLDEEITSFENAYEGFEKVQRYMKKSLYEEALDEIELIDKKFLSDADAKMLDEYSEEINNFFETRDKEDENSSDVLSIKEAEIIITQYCEDLAMAVNNRDFAVVEKHISGQLYNDQKKYVQTCIEKSTVQSFDELQIISVNAVSDTKWKVQVVEGKTLYQTDGTQTPSKNNLTYTIENIDSVYYITSVE